MASGFTPDIRLDAPDPLTALGLVASGLGLALIQKSMMPWHTQGVEVRELPWYQASVTCGRPGTTSTCARWSPSFRETVLTHRTTPPPAP